MFFLNKFPNGTGFNLNPKVYVAVDIFGVFWREKLQSDFFLHLLRQQ